MLSMQVRRKILGVVLTTLLCILTWLAQLLLLNKLVWYGASCNLLLTLTIVWGLVFGSPLPEVSPGELRMHSTLAIFLHQSLSGSVSGALVGGFCGALYAAVEPTFPWCFPIIGWIAGYFCLNKTSKETLLCIPLVLLGTILAETIMSIQLTMLGNSSILERLFAMALPEATLNALFAPLFYLPLRHIHDLST